MEGPPDRRRRRRRLRHRPRRATGRRRSTSATRTATSVQILADLGLAGLLLTLAPRSRGSSPRAGRCARVAGAERAGLLTLGAIVLVFAVHSFVDWTWFVPGNALVALLAAGWLAGRGPGRPDPLLPRPGLHDRGRVVAAVVVALLALATAWSVWQPLRAQERGADALDAAAERKFDEARDLVEQARDINPLSIEPLLELAAVEQAAGRRDEAEHALAGGRPPAAERTRCRGCAWPSTSSTC